jgi:hypothetical protein
MTRTLRNTGRTLAAIGFAGAALLACDSEGTSTLSGGGHTYTPVESPAASAAAANASTGGNATVVTTPAAGGVTPGTGGTTGNTGADPTAATNANITGRQVNYGEAMRTASLKLLGDLPTIAQIDQMEITLDPTAQATLYASMIDSFLADPRFAAKMIQYWRDTLKTGQQGTPAKGMPSFDTAATYAAEVVVNDQPFTNIFTATSGTCPTFDGTNFTPADCANNAPTTGILTDPGLMSQYYSNMAFRRVRFIQETFVCSKFPAEFSAKSVPMGVGAYTSPWDFDSIAGGTTAKINFQDTSSIICADCHTTMNHMAPLFANFDDSGQYISTAFQVQVPVIGTPIATITDWLPAGQTFAWRDGTTVADLPSLGKAIAADPDVAMCAVNRIWDFAMSRGDIVNDLATVPPIVTQQFATDFTTNGMSMKKLIREVFTSDDFVKF